MDSIGEIHSSFGNSEEFEILNLEPSQSERRESEQDPDLVVLSPHASTKARTTSYDKISREGKNYNASQIDPHSESDYIPQKIATNPWPFTNPEEESGTDDFVFEGPEDLQLLHCASSFDHISICSAIESRACSSESISLSKTRSLDDHTVLISNQPTCKSPIDAAHDDYVSPFELIALEDRIIVSYYNPYNLVAECAKKAGTSFHEIKPVKSRDIVEYTPRQLIKVLQSSRTIIEYASQELVEVLQSSRDVVEYTSKELVEVLRSSRDIVECASRELVEVILSSRDVIEYTSRELVEVRSLSRELVEALSISRELVEVFSHSHQLVEYTSRELIEVLSLSRQLVEVFSLSYGIIEYTSRELVPSQELAEISRRIFFEKTCHQKEVERILRKDTQIYALDGPCPCSIPLLTFSSITSELAPIRLSQNLIKEPEEGYWNATKSLPESTKEIKSEYFTEFLKNASFESSIRPISSQLEDLPKGPFKKLPMVKKNGYLSLGRKAWVEQNRDFGPDNEDLWAPNKCGGFDDSAILKATKRIKRRRKCDFEVDQSGIVYLSQLPEFDAMETSKTKFIPQRNLKPTGEDSGFSKKTQVIPADERASSNVQDIYDIDSTIGVRVSVFMMLFASWASVYMTQQWS